MLNINNLHFHLGTKDIFEGANFTIRPGNRVGVVGKNGAGKSTLLRIIAGEFKVSATEYSRPNSLKLAFFNQDLLSYETEKSLLEVAKEGFEELKQIEADLELAEADLHLGTEEAINRYGDLQERYMILGGYEMEATAGKILAGLGFNDADLARQFKEFSGGWRMRALLARSILAKPDLLMLDEPTNHLDLPSIKWLESFLSSFEGMLMVVSHDRTFLNKACDHIAEVSLRKINLFKGNYDDYIEQKEERAVLNQSAYDNQQTWIKEQERFIERFKAKASKATAAQSRVKMLEKVDRIEIEETDSSAMRLRLKPAVMPGRNIMELKVNAKRYGDLEVLRASDCTLHRGEKVALIGANGIGKSTLLRMMAGMEPMDGQRQQGHNVALSFYAQHQLESLNLKNSILDELQHDAPQYTEKDARTLLGSLLFSNDDVLKPVGVLSGGEKARVALAKVVASGANTLLFDEPTNHLDIMSIDILARSLKEFEGTVVVVSHDRDFLRKVADIIWYIEDKQLKAYPGSYDEFEIFMGNRVIKNVISKMDGKAADEEVKPMPKPSAQPAPKPANTPKNQAAQGKLKQQVAFIESEIEALEAKIKTLELQLNDPTIYQTDPALTNKLASEHLTLKQQLTKHEAQWESLAAELEAA